MKVNLGISNYMDDLKKYHIINLMASEKEVTFRSFPNNHVKTTVEVPSPYSTNSNLDNRSAVPIANEPMMELEWECCSWAVAVNICTLTCLYALLYDYYMYSRNIPTQADGSTTDT